MAYESNRLQLYQHFLQLLLQLAQKEEDKAPDEVVAVAVPSFEASLLEIGESRSLAIISTSTSVSSTSTRSSCGGGAGEDILRDFSVSNHGKVPLLKNTSNQYKSFLLMDESFDKESDPSLCTSGTHRCNHVNDAYATYPGRWLTTNENTKPTTLPKLSPTQKQQQLISQRQYRLSANSNVASGKTRVISSSKSTPGEPVTFEIKHGAEKNIFTLPTDEISNKKKWQVTFTIGMDKNNKQLGLTKEGGGPLQN
ncbi:hypothetical protein GQR58_007644 [Nymphon striatum]|nr:hypothetical protein GQR58_007644 [Nymphon striatum]